MNVVVKVLNKSTDCYFRLQPPFLWLKDCRGYATCPMLERWRHQDVLADQFHLHGPPRSCQSHRSCRVDDIQIAIPWLWKAIPLAMNRVGTFANKMFENEIVLVIISMVSFRVTFGLYGCFFVCACFCFVLFVCLLLLFVLFVFFFFVFFLFFFGGGWRGGGCGGVCLLVFFGG